MIDSPALEAPWLITVLLLSGAALIALLGWLLGRPKPLAAWADDLGELAWMSIRHVRRVFVVLAAATLLLAGIALLVLPGPGTLFLAGALGLLATEFVWARRWIRDLQRRLEGLGEGARGIFGNRSHIASQTSTASPAQIEADQEPE